MSLTYHEIDVYSLIEPPSIFIPPVSADTHDHERAQGRNSAAQDSSAEEKNLRSKSLIECKPASASASSKEACEGFPARCPSPRMAV
jgi:hypothetical protein